MCGRKKRILSVDTGAQHSIIRSDLVNTKIKPLAGAKLRTVTREYTQVLEVTCEIVIRKVAVLHNLKVADIFSEIIIGVDLLANQEKKTHLENRIMTYTKTEMIIMVD